MGPLDTVIVFAYGSNMFTVRIRERIPSAEPWGIGQLTGHTLRWHKRSTKDGSGKCDAEFTGRDVDVVWGVLFTCPVSEKLYLDQDEGLGSGYDEKEVEIITETGALTAFMYFATDKDPSLQPYHWYKGWVVRGALEHGLPQDYIARLEAVSSIPDPDRERANKNEQLLIGAGGQNLI